MSTPASSSPRESSSDSNFDNEADPLHPPSYRSNRVVHVQYGHNGRKKRTRSHPAGQSHEDCENDIKRPKKIHRTVSTGLALLGSSSSSSIGDHSSNSKLLSKATDMTTSDMDIEDDFLPNDASTPSHDAPQAITSNSNYDSILSNTREAVSPIADAHPSPDSSFLTPRPIRPLAAMGHVAGATEDMLVAKQSLSEDSDSPETEFLPQKVNGADSQMLPSPATKDHLFMLRPPHISSPIVALSQNQGFRTSSLSNEGVLMSKRRRPVASSSAVLQENYTPRPLTSVPLASPFHLRGPASGRRRPSNTKRRSSNRKKSSRPSFNKPSVHNKLTQSLRRASASVDCNGKTVSYANDPTFKRRQSGPSALSKPGKGLDMGEEEEDWNAQISALAPNMTSADEDEYMLDSSFFTGVRPIDASTPLGNRGSAKSDVSFSSDDDEDSAIFRLIEIGPVLGTGGMRTMVMDDSLLQTVRTPSVRSSTPNEQDIDEDDEATPKSKTSYAPILSSAYPPTFQQRPRPASSLRRTVTTRDVYQDSILSSFEVTGSSGIGAPPTVYPKTPLNRSRSGPAYVASNAIAPLLRAPQNSSPIIATPGCVPRRASNSLSQSHLVNTVDSTNVRSPEDELMDMFSAHCEIADDTSRPLGSNTDQVHVSSASLTSHVQTPTSPPVARRVRVPKSSVSSRLKENIPFEPAISTPISNTALASELNMDADADADDETDTRTVPNAPGLVGSIPTPISSKRTKAKGKGKNVRFNNASSSFRNKKNLVAMSSLDTTKVWMKVRYSDSENENNDGLDSGDESDLDELLLGESGLGQVRLSGDEVMK